MAGKVVDQDKGFKRILREIFQGKKLARVTMGVHETEGQKANGKFTVAEIAAVHEYGNEDSNIPERSFVRSSHDENLSANQKLLKKKINQVFMGKIKRRQALAFVGEVASKQMVEKLNLGVEPALKPKTIKRKKSSKPLIDSGQMKGSISFEVHE